MQPTERESLNELDLKATDPDVLVKIAAAAQALAGVFIGLCGLQVIGLESRRFELLNALPYFFMVSGLALLLLGSRVYRARTWAAYGAAGLAPLLTLILGSWVVYSFGAVFSCLVMVTLPTALLASVFSVLAVKGVRRAAAARARLEAAGMGLGF